MVHLFFGIFAHQITVVNSRQQTSPCFQTRRKNRTPALVLQHQPPNHMMPIPLVEVLVWVWVFVELSSSLMMRTIPLILWKGFLLAISCLGFEFASFLIKPEGMCCFCVAGHQAKFLSKSSLACYIFKVELGT